MAGGAANDPGIVSPNPRGRGRAGDRGLIRKLLLNCGYHVLGISDPREVSLQFDLFRPNA
jgi:hypothetical protein